MYTGKDKSKPLYTGDSRGDTMMNTLYLNNDFAVIHYIRKADGNPATGLTVSSSFIPDTTSSASPLISIGLTERDDTPGQYEGVFLGADLSVSMSASLDKHVYHRVYFNTDYDALTPYIVRGYRLLP